MSIRVKALANDRYFKEMLAPDHFCMAQFQKQLVLLLSFFILEMQGTYNDSIRMQNI